MRTSVRLCGAAGISAASLMMIAAPAFADSAGNNGINLLDDNNISVLPIQNCGKITVLGDLIKVSALNSHHESQSPHAINCVNAPIVDHANAGS